MPSLRHFVFMQFLLLGNNCWNNWNQETHPACLAQDMKRCYLQKKNCVNIFKSLVAWGLLRLKFWNENSFTSPHSIIYHYQKASKDFFATQKSLRFLQPMRILIDSILFRFHSDKFLIGVFIYMVLLESSVIWSFLSPQWYGPSWVLSDMDLLESSAIWTFLSPQRYGPSWVLSDKLFFRILINRFFFRVVSALSFGSSVLFLWHAATVLSKYATPFFIKNRCSVLHYIFKKKVTFNH